LLLDALNIWATNVIVFSLWYWEFDRGGSPTDTMPLTNRMKLLMMLEATISLLTLALVAARAVNILA
jgi:hypothetical protein